MTRTPYLLITAANGKLLNSDSAQPDPVRFERVPFPDRPALSSAATPFFPVDDFSCGTAAALRAGTMAAGKATFEPLSVGRQFDTASPTLAARLFAGASLKYVDLVLLNNFPGDDYPNELHEALGLGTVFVHATTWAGADDLTESARFDYGQIWIGYSQLDQYGQAQTFTVRGWDRVAGKPL